MGVKRHLVIPDCQIRKDDDLYFLRKIGEYSATMRPDNIICLGDFADLPSLSAYDKGTGKAWNQTYQEDIDAAKAGMEVLMDPITKASNRSIKNKKKVWRPKLDLMLGNHEERLMRYANAHPELQGKISYADLGYEHFGWTVHDYLKPVSIDGIMYCHFIPNPMTGKPYSGSASNILQKVGSSFVVGHKQGCDVATRNLPLTGQAQWGIIVGSCLEQNHRVLTSDLRYIPLKDLKVGDTVVSFEENVTPGKRSRRYKKGTVLALKPIKKETLKVTLESGKEFVVTGDHLWFTKLTGGAQAGYRWVPTSKLRKGTCIPKLFDEWETLDSFDAGWLSGMYDGEGCLHQRKTSGGYCVQLGVCQKAGLVLEKLKQVTKDIIGEDLVTNCHHEKTQVTNLRVKGGVRGILKILGSVRPIRLLAKFDANNIGSICSPDKDLDRVVAITPVGENTVMEIDVDTKTMIVEGYGHHNCYEHNEGYKGYTGNHHYRGIVVLNEVSNGAFDPMFVSLDYLTKRFK